MIIIILWCKKIVLSHKKKTLAQSHFTLLGVKKKSLDRVYQSQYIVEVLIKGNNTLLLPLLMWSRLSFLDFFSFLIWEIFRQRKVISKFKVWNVGPVSAITEHILCWDHFGLLSKLSFDKFFLPNKGITKLPLFLLLQGCLSLV